MREFFSSGPRKYPPVAIMVGLPGEHRPKVHGLGAGRVSTNPRSMRIMSARLPPANSKMFLSAINAFEYRVAIFSETPHLRNCPLRIDRTKTPSAAITTSCHGC